MVDVVGEVGVGGVAAGVDDADRDSLAGEAAGAQRAGGARRGGDDVAGGGVEQVELLVGVRVERGAAGHGGHELGRRALHEREGQALHRLDDEAEVAQCGDLGSARRGGEGDHRAVLESAGGQQSVEARARGAQRGQVGGGGQGEVGGGRARDADDGLHGSGVRRGPGGRGDRGGAGDGEQPGAEGARGAGGRAPGGAAEQAGQRAGHGWWGLSIGWRVNAARPGGVTPVPRPRPAPPGVARRRSEGRGAARACRRPVERAPGEGAPRVVYGWG